MTVNKRKARKASRMSMTSRSLMDEMERAITKLSQQVLHWQTEADDRGKLWRAEKIAAEQAQIYFAKEMQKSREEKLHFLALIHLTQPDAVRASIRAGVMEALSELFQQRASPKKPARRRAKRR